MLINIGIWNKKIRIVVLILHLIITWLLINYKIVLFSIHKELLLKLNEISYMKNADNLKKAIEVLLYLNLAF